MLRLVFAAALFLVAGVAQAAITLPVRGSVDLIDPAVPLAAITGSVTFDADALVNDFDATPALGLSLLVEVFDGTGFPAGIYPVELGDPRFNWPPEVARIGDDYYLDIDATAAFAGIDYDVLTFPDVGTGRSFLTVLAGGFLPFAEGSLEVVPLPAAVWMLGAGLLGLAAMRRFRPRGGEA